MTAQIYVISPVSSDSQYTLKRRIIEACADAAGFSTLFPMDALREKVDSRTNIRRAMHQMGDAPIVIADLSLERPSCYFELGVAVASKARIVLIARAGTDIHQTPWRDSVRWYSDLDAYEQLISAVMGELK